MNKLLIFLLALLITVPVFAGQDPQQMIKNASEEMLSTLNERRAELEVSSELLIKLADEILTPYFDFNRISRLVLGKYWRKASSEQRKSFSKEFHSLLLRTYAKALLTLGSEEIRYPPLKPSKRPDRVTVATLVKKEGSANPVPISYRLHQKENDWKVYDVVIDGVSLVSNYRRDFSTQIKREGIESLIVAMRKRNQTGTE